MQNRSVFKVFAVIFLLFLTTGCIHRLRFRTEPQIRVLLFTGVSRATLSSDCDLIVETNGMRGLSPSYSVWEVEYNNGKLSAHIKDKFIKNIGEYVKFYTKKPWGTVYLGGKGYKGGITFKLNGSGLEVINDVPLETYLKGVVPYEIGNLGMDKIEAVKAQAVAARTYAIRKVRNGQNRDFDVYNDVRDQVYKGVLDNSNVTDMACDATRGIILTYKGKPIDAKYSSTCGGVTADARELWTDKKIPYLTPVIDAKSFLIFKGKAFCSASKYSNWEIDYTRGDFYDLIKTNLRTLTGKQPDDVGSVKSVVITKRGPSRRVTEVIVYTTKGEFRVEKNNIRLLMKNTSDPSKSLLSTYFTLKIGLNNVRIIGKGFGHGAGMCQYGAMGMAKSGYNYKDILKHYYRGVHLEKVY